MKPERYLQMLLRRDSVPRKTIGDYLLCGYLIDKDVDRFAQEIGKYYTVDEHLPKHYREALTMYTHLRSNPVQVYHVPVVKKIIGTCWIWKRSMPEKWNGKRNCEINSRELTGIIINMNKKKSSPIRELSFVSICRDIA